MESYSLFKILICVILMQTQNKFQVHSGYIETIPGNPNHKSAGSAPVSAQQQQHLSAHRAMMSCYACSTMDYENPADNPCRFMPKHHHRTPSQVGLNHGASMINYATASSPLATTTEINLGTTTESLQVGTSNSTLPLFGAGPQESDHYYSQDSSPGGAPTSATPYSLSRESAQSAKSTIVVTPTTSALNAAAYLHRAPPPGSSIRTRPCFEEENFCSIVSVARIEFMNDTIVSRFWAMERNCSKSCNTGCMLIGERVRLRVCSHCCRTPNCNIGNGAQTASALTFRELGISLVSIIVTLFIKYRSPNIQIENVSDHIVETAI